MTMFRGFFKRGELRLSFTGEDGKTVSSGFIREKAKSGMLEEGIVEKVLIQLFDEERFVSMKGNKDAGGTTAYTCSTQGVPEEEIVFFGLEWIAKVAEIHLKSCLKDEQIGDKEEEEAMTVDVNEVESGQTEDIVGGLSEMIGFNNFADLMQTFLAGEIQIEK